VSATEITVIGNVVDSPRRVRLQNGSVTNFRLAATERRFDRERQEYVDGNTFWVDVECFNELGGNVSRSISKGDPVVVVGTLSTHQWESDQGRRSRPQIRAEAVGPNLARGTADFRRAVRAPAPQEQSAPPADATGAERFDDTTGLVAGRDYEADLATLEQVNSDDTVLEPALH
jgi:single-strand DNA-binding protein